MSELLGFLESELIVFGFPTPSGVGFLREQFFLALGFQRVVRCKGVIGDHFRV
jgi:hypothetical protein